MLIPPVRRSSSKNNSAHCMESVATVAVHGDAYSESPLTLLELASVGHLLTEALSMERLVPSAGNRFCCWTMTDMSKIMRPTVCT